MVQYLYLLCLIGSVSGVAMIDMKYGQIMLSGKKAFVPIASCVLFLLIADITGIALGIFSTNPLYVSGLYLFTPDLPVEEIILLIFLPYLALVIRDIIRKHNFLT